MTILVDNNSSTSLRRMTTGPIPSVPFVAIKNAILGKKYELSVLFPDNKTSVSLHTTWKGKKTPVNVLAFPLDKTSGEIIITLATARKEAHLHGYTYSEYLIYLFIHACVHLLGHTHGSAMEKLEQRYRKKFGLL